MNAPAIKFNRKDQPEFVRELRKRVNTYFKENKISKYANMTMKVKTGFMLSLYFIPLLLINVGAISGIWPALLMWTLMGLGMSGIGLSVMHDANHGAYSQNKRVNEALSFTLNLLGGYHINWRIQHNVLHHSYTNVHGHDEDLENAVMRLSPYQEYKKIYRFQAFYAVFFYSIQSLYWFVAKDFDGLIRYNKQQLFDAQGRTFNKALFEIILSKLIYILITIALPIIMLNIPWWVTIIGFVWMHVICGLFLALIFQPAHVLEETEFFNPDSNGSVENSWAIHQLKTTANFANGSRLFSWFIGGLNYQIEHHLFPNICHVHYRKISKIVKETAKEFNLPYHQHRTFLDALKSHFTLLYQLGTGRHDEKLLGA